MSRPTCGDFACVLSLICTQGYGCGRAPGIPCALLMEGNEQDPDRSAAGMRTRGKPDPGRYWLDEACLDAALLQPKLPLQTKERLMKLARYALDGAVHI